MGYIIQSSKNNNDKYMYIGDEGKPIWYENPAYATIFNDYREVLTKANNSRACGVSILEIKRVYTKEDKLPKERVGEALSEEEHSFWLTLKALPTRETKTKEDLICYIINEAEREGFNLHNAFKYVNREYKYVYDANFKKINVLGYDIKIRGCASDITFDVQLPQCPFTNGDDEKLSPYSFAKKGNFLEKLKTQYFTDNYTFRAYGTGKGFWAEYRAGSEHIFDELLNLLGIDKEKLSPTSIKRGDKEAIKYMFETIEHNKQNIRYIQTAFEAWLDNVCEKVKPDLEKIINYMMSGGNI